MKIAIACDHAGYEYKERLVKYLREKGHEVKDFGAYSAESMDYPDTAHPMAAAVESGEYEKGIAICGSGNGISMTANKHQGIRCALCWNMELAALAFYDWRRPERLFAFTTSEMSFSLVCKRFGIFGQLELDTV